MRIEVNMHQAKTDLSKLVAQAWEGHEVIITRDGRPVARLAPFAAGPRVAGRLRDKMWISPDFDAPMPEEWLRAFYGEGDDRGADAGPDEAPRPE